MPRGDVADGADKAPLRKINVKKKQQYKQKKGLL